MASKIELTPYQQSLMDKGRKSQTLSKKLYKGLITLTAILVGFAFFANVLGYLTPTQLAAPLFLTYIYIFFNWFSAAIMGAAYVIFQCCRLILKHSTEENDLSIMYKARSLTVGFVQKVPLFNYKLSNPLVLIDVIADWFLFIMLVLSNHPLLATFHAGSLIAQYWTVKGVENVVTKIVSTLNDPLGGEINVNMDDLMDKLCNPEDNHGPQNSN
jgi:hypothetical protein